MKNISNKENEKTFPKIKVASIKGRNILSNMNKLKNSRYRPWIDYLAIEMKRLDSPHVKRED